MQCGAVRHNRNIFLYPVETTKSTDDRKRTLSLIVLSITIGMIFPFVIDGEKGQLLAIRLESSENTAYQ